MNDVNPFDRIDPTSDACITWAIRFFLGRDPIDRTEIDFHRAGHANFSSIRAAFCQTREFKEYFEVVNSNTLQDSSVEHEKCSVVELPALITSNLNIFGSDSEALMQNKNNNEINLIDVFKSYKTRRGINTVLKSVSLKINSGDKIGILGRNGAGKSTLIRLISGAERPTTGKVSRELSVSWPLAFGGAFQGSLTGLDNLRFICRAYGVELSDKVSYVEDFSELGKYLKEPVKTYSSGMRARLAFAISMIVEFDCYLIDEVVSVGDARFTAKCQRELFEKRGDRAMIIVSHEPHHIRDHCDRVCIINEGHLFEYKNVDEAYREYNKSQC